MPTDRPRRPRPDGAGPRKGPAGGPGRPRRPGASGGRPAAGGPGKARRGPGAGASGKGPTGRKPGGSRGVRRSGESSAPARRERPEPRTEAERRAAEVRARRAPRAPVDPDTERRRIEERQTEHWIDEGSIRAEAQAATARAGATRPRRDAELDPEVLAQVHSAAADQRRAERMAERLTAASAALDRERFDDVRRMVAPVVKEMPQLAAGHELSGLANYRTGRWREAAAALEQARQLRPDPALLPVLADCYRALGRWPAVEAVWREIRAASPSHEVMAEGRIVVAGAHADRGELKEAIALLAPAAKPPKKVRDYHLRQWYVLGDLYDRAGDTMGATRWFREVLAHDPDFADTRERLRSLGR